MNIDAQTILKLKIFQARLGLLWEQVWQAAFWPMMIVGIAVLGVLSGGVALLPFYGRLILILLVFISFLMSLKTIFKIVWPDKNAGVRRLEQRSGLPHRPVSTWHDQIVDDDGYGGGDENAKIIWAAHQKRQKEKFENLKVGAPQSNWMYKDPNAWRFGLAGLLFVAVFFNGANWRAEIFKIAQNGKPVVEKPMSLDAWLSPPSFTKKAPVLLTGKTRANGANGQGGVLGDIIVPEGSKLVVRINGAKGGQIVLSALQDGAKRDGGKVLKTIDLTTKPLDEKTPETTIEKNTIEKTLVLKRPVFVRVRYGAKSGGEQNVGWAISLIPDATPKIEILGKIRKTPTGGFGVNWLASDDYGVGGISGKLTLVGPSSGVESKNTKREKPLSYKPPEFSISLPSLNPKKAKGIAFQDLTAHPWAGKRVKLVLSVKDQGGQVAKSAPMTFVLPQRLFVKPLAKALVEQRGNLVVRPSKKSNVVKMFAALMAWPDGLFERSGVYLSMRSVATALHQSQTDKQLKTQVKNIWDLALVVEDGNLSKALARLEAIRKELQKALRDGASPKKIAELTAKLRQALKNYMAAMERNLAQQLSKNKNAQNGLRQQRGREIRARDLQKMMDKIENLAKSGAKGAAQEMLSQLENILKNLNPSLAQQPMAPQRTPPGAKALEKLTDLLRRQRELMDQTFNMPDQQNRNSQPNQQNQRQSQRPNGNQPNAKRPNGQKGTQQQGRKGNQQLSAQQRALAKQLGKVLDQMAKNGLPAPKALNKAGRAMREAEQALKNGGKGRAMGYQGQAMQGLRKGAEAMAKDLQNRGKGEQGNFGRHAQENGPQSNDPLGRPMPKNSSDFGPDKNIIPKNSQIMRAQDIMRTLRERSNDRQRSKQELQYLERLLDGLF